MNDYTVYCLARGGRLLSAERIKAPSDDEALSAAARSRFGAKAEVWLESRRVGTIEMDPDDEASPRC